MREFRSYGSVRGVLGNRHPYRDPGKAMPAGWRNEQSPYRWNQRGGSQPPLASRPEGLAWMTVERSNLAAEERR